MEFIMSALSEGLTILVTALLLFVSIKLSTWLTDTVVGKKVNTFVLAAEKLKETWQITDKPEYVEQMLSLAGIKITPTVQAMIEAACKSIDISLDAGVPNLLVATPKIEE